MLRLKHFPTIRSRSLKRNNHILMTNQTTTLFSSRIHQSSKEQKFRTEITDFYNSLDEAISKKHEKANAKNKPCLLILGEKTDDLGINLAELSLIKLADKHRINTLAVAIPPTILELVLTENQTELKKYRPYASNFEKMIKYGKKQGLNLVSVDPDFKDWPDIRNLESMNDFREDYIIKSLISNINTSALLCVGGLHLVNLKNHPKLNIKFNLLGINSMNLRDLVEDRSKSAKSVIKAFNDKDIFQANVAKFDSSYSEKQLIELFEAAVTNDIAKRHTL